MCSIVVNVPDCQSGDWSSILPHPANPLYYNLLKSYPTEVGRQWRGNSVGLGLVLKTMGAVKCLGVGTSSLHKIVFFDILVKEWRVNLRGLGIVC